MVHRYEIAALMLSLACAVMAQEGTYTNRDLGGKACLAQIVDRIEQLDSRLSAGVADQDVASDLVWQRQEALAQYASWILREETSVLWAPEPWRDAEAKGLLTPSTRATFLALSRLWRVARAMPPPYHCIQGTDLPSFLAPGDSAPFEAYLQDTLEGVAAASVAPEAGDAALSVARPLLPPRLQAEDLENRELARAVARAAQRGMPIVVELAVPIVCAWQREAAPLHLGEALGDEAAYARIDLGMDRCGAGARLAGRLHVDQRAVAVFDERGALLDRVDGHDGRRLWAGVREALAGRSEVQELMQRPERCVSDGLRLAGLLAAQARAEESEAELRRVVQRGGEGSVEALVYLAILRTTAGDFDGGLALAEQYLVERPAGPEAELAQRLREAIRASAPSPAADDAR